MSIMNVVTTKRRRRRDANPALLTQLEQWTTQMLVADARIPADGPGLVEAVVDRAVQWLGVNHAAVYRVDVPGEKVSCIAARGLSEAFIQGIEQQDNDVSRAWARLIADPLLVDEVAEDPRVEIVRSWLSTEGIRSFLAVPLWFGGSLAGAVVFSHEQRHDWSRRQRVLVNLLAWQTMVALEIWRLSRVAVEALQVEDIFLSRASHELRTPLTSIIAYTQYLERYLANTPGSDFELRQLRVIEAQAMHLARLVQDVLDVKTMDSEQLRLRKEPLDLRELVCDAIREVEPIAGDHSLSMITPTELPDITGDRYRLRQVMGQLLSNAVKYSPDGGEVTVQLTCQDGFVTVAVRDKGIGVEEADRSLIFERFYQAEKDPRSRRYGGLGIGLHTSKAIIEAHGGRIGIESGEGTGSTFWFALPMNS